MPLSTVTWRRRQVAQGVVKGTEGSAGVQRFVQGAFSVVWEVLGAALEQGER